MRQPAVLAVHLEVFGKKKCAKRQMQEHFLQRRAKAQMPSECKELCGSIEHTHRSGDNAAPF